MKYFVNCHTLEELKKEYRRLALENHPDRGGDEMVMKEINAEYEKMAGILENAQTASGEEPKHKSETPAEFIEIIDRLMKLNGIEIEVCGSWLWVSGNTYPNRTQIAEIGFKYSKTKKAWYWFKGIENTSKRRGTKTMDAIRREFGSDLFKSTGYVALEA